MTGPAANDGAATQVDQWVARAKAKAERYQAMQAAVGQVAVTESSKDGMVTVTVDSTGNLSDLRITDRVRELSGAQVAAAVLGTVRRAQAKLPERLGEVMKSTIGDDVQTQDKIVGEYRAKFPEPEPEPDEPRQPSAGAAPVRKIGVLEEEAPAAPPPAAPAPAPDATAPPATPPSPPPAAPPVPQRTPRRRPAKDEDSEDDDGFGESFMVRR
jgi:DNA-binding protein YbaB